jgi:neurotransmitter:Na+ symporter, NSS family
MFVLAASGAGIGFNNIWQFPHLAAEYGGGAFILVYVVCVLVLGVPLLMAEMMLGREGRGSPIHSFRRLAERVRAEPNWVLVGWMGVIGGFLIFSYLSVIAGWATAYFIRSAFGVFVGQTADGINSLFTLLVRDPEKQLFWHSLFVVATMVVSARGLRWGLEPVIKFFVPLMFLLLMVLAGYAATTDAFGHSLATLLQFDFTRLSSFAILSALAHAFFSLGLGVGAMLMYGAYLDHGAPILKVSLLVAGLDTAAGLLAAIAIFALLTSGGVGMASGPTLVFQALPLAFDHLPAGRLFGTLFFMALVIAAWMTAIALVEPVMVWLGERFNFPRFQAAIVCGAVAWTLGVITILSFNYWAYTFMFFGVLKKLGFFDIVQILTAYVLLPIGGILVALFCGWTLKPFLSRTALALPGSRPHVTWLWLMRLVIPVLLAIVIIRLPELFA